MKKDFGVFLTLSLSLLFLSTFTLPTVHARKGDDGTKLQVLDSYGKLPLSFIENKGQMDKRVSYYLKGRQGTIYFTKRGIIYDLISTNSLPCKVPEKEPKEVQRLSFTLRPIGARQNAMLIANDRLRGKVNYFIGSDPKGWRTDIAMYGEILYKDLFKRIDLRLYGTNEQMEYDFIVHPGADPDDIRMGFNGIEGLKVDEAGNLVIRTLFGDLKHLKPVIYQEIEGRREVVKGSFKVAENSFGFDIHDYNREYPLIIDPLTLSYSTYLGGSNDDRGFDIAVDSSGNAYVTGYTNSTDFPTENPYQGTSGGSNDIFVTKLGAAGDTLIYSTYLGGSSWDNGWGIAVDSSGNAYVTGNTNSTDFPTQNPYQGTYGGGAEDVFVTKLGAAGDTLSYSTYLGGTGYEYSVDIAVDSSGNAYVTGYTNSTDFPTENPYQGTSGGSNDIFVTKLGAAGDTLSYSTYLGGGGNDYGERIAVDSSGNASVTGYTYSTDFPTQNPYQGTSGGMVDGFVTKLGAAGDTLSYSTYLGGSGDDYGVDIVVDSSGNAYVTGETSSGNFPTQNPYQGTWGGGLSDAFVTKLDPAGDTVSYSTYLGGNGAESGYGIAVDTLGYTYVVGRTDSTDFPTQNAYQGTWGGGPTDAFVTKLAWNEPLCCAKPTLQAPSGDQPTYQWLCGCSEGWTWYWVYVLNLSTGAYYGSGWVNSSLNTWDQPSQLPWGSYRVWVQVYHSQCGYSQWSDPQDWTVGNCCAKPTLQGPSGDQPTYQWDGGGGEWEWFWVYVQNLSTGAYYGSGWVNSSLNTWDQPSQLPWGSYRVWVQAYHSQCGFSAWSDPQDWSVGNCCAKPTLQTPSGEQPTYQWSCAGGEWTWFWVYVLNVNTGAYYGTGSASYGWVNSIDNFWNSAYTLPAGDYQAWVRVYHGNCGLSEWSDPVDWTVEGGPATLDGLPILP